MYNNDSNSLNAGAPDIRLSGNQQMASLPDPTAEMNDFSMKVFGKPLHQLTPPQLEQLYELMNEQAKAPQQNSGIMASAPGLYSQKRKQMMAYGGIAGADGRKKYGIGSFFQDIKDKIVDDIIPNEIKNPAALATIAGLGLNQFGLPDVLTEKMGMGSDVGQNWLGDLLGAAIPGDTQFNTVLGDTLPFMFQDTTASQYPIGGFDQIAREAILESAGKNIAGKPNLMEGITSAVPSTL